MKNVWRSLILFLVVLAFSSKVHGQCSLTVSPSNASTCPGDSVQVSVTGGTTYIWSPAVGLSCTTCASPWVQVDSALTYTVTSSTSGNQNAVNWNFSNGNTGFSTQYLYNPTSIWNEGTYAVGPNANAVHPNFAAWGDHTTGTGNYMIINGSTNGIKTIWSQTVALPAGSNATLSIWMLTLATPAGQFRVKINGTIIGSNQTTPATVGVWGNYTFPFTVPAAGNVTVVIESVSTALAGNDFGLDDIQFTYSCTATATLNVQPYPRPEALAHASDSLGCAGLCVQWADSSTVANGASIIWRQWSWGDGSQDTGRFPVHCYLDEGTYQGQLVVVSNQGCRDTVLLRPVTIASPPTLEVVFDSTTSCSSAAFPTNPLLQPPVFYPNTSEPCYFYRLNLGAFGPIIPDSTQVTVQYGPGGPTTTSWITGSSPGTTWFSGTIPVQWAARPTEICFQLLVPGGCVDSLCFPLRFAPEVSLPNVFTPNSDGLNDGFLPEFENVDWAHWEIYSRWGQKVYQSESYTQAWDGRINGKEAAAGVYFVVVSAGNSDVPEAIFARGTLHLMR